MFGRGPGEGVVKLSLPDAHSDFVFAVAGEEFGLLICLFITAVFAFIVLRGFHRLKTEHDPFVTLAATGLAAGFGLQAFVNMASTVRRYGKKMVDDGFFSNEGELLHYAHDLEMLHTDPHNKSLAWKHGLDHTVLQKNDRVTEIKNWIEHQVIPTRARRGRG